MRHLPRSSFSLINIRHANLAGDLLSAQLELWMLNADFVGSPTLAESSSQEISVTHFVATAIVEGHERA
jgi:hypothetical protein